MRAVSVIIPVWNEQDTILSLVRRIDDVLTKAKLVYEIIFIDDNSTDKTYRRIISLKHTYPVQVFKKIGKRGKAQSLIEGFSHAKYASLAMMDGDLQYPPEALPEMIAMLKNTDIIAANRVIQNTSKIRKIISKSFKNIFGKFLFGLDHDVQAGLKVFTREVYEHLHYHPTSGWTFDLEFLHKAKQAGFSIENYDIIYEKRASGNSKVSFIKTSLEIGINAIAVKAKSTEPLHFRSLNSKSMQGAGVRYKKKKYITHTTLHHSQSAIKTFIDKQRFYFGFLFLALLIGLISRTLLTLQILVGILSFIYFIDVVFNLFLVMKSLHFPQEITATDEELTSLKDEDLPIYSILCPLYKEAHIIPQFVESISKLNWPKEKLDVMLLLEEDDKVSIETVKQLRLPSYIRSVVVPHSMPKTKPKACNYGLSKAKGEYLVIYDAEDMPDPLQLKKAFLGFQKSGNDVLCLQAKLNYYNPHQNLLTRFFTAEYSLWFDVTLTGLQAANTSIPLGGTSNHFRVKDLHALEGWDPFNVTEDADLGIRLFKKGFRTAIIDSVTLEEANSNVFNWIRQRSRWIKGYMQTYLVHTRKRFGYHTNLMHTILFHLNIGGKIAFILINPILWILTISYFALYSFVGPSIEALYPSYIFYMAAFSLVAGNFLFLYYYMIGCAKRDQWELVKFIYLVPLYWLIISWAGFVAFYQLLFKPHYWEKTIHGLHQKKTQQRIIAEAVVESEENEYRYRFSSRFRKKILELIVTKKQITSGALLILALNLGNVLNFLYNAYLGRVLDFDDFALISLLGSFITFLTFFTSPLSGSVNYKGAFLIGKFNKDAAQIFWKLVRKYALLIGALLSVLWLIAIPFLVNFFHSESTIMFVVFAPLFIVSLVAAVDRGYMSSKLLFALLAIVTAIEPILKLSSAIILSVFDQHIVYLAVPFSILGSFLTGWYLVVRSNNKNLLSENTQENIHFPKKYYIASLLSGISTVAYLSLDIVLAKHYLSPTEAGKYALVSLIGKMVYFLGGLASPFITPLVSRNEGAKKSSTLTLSIITFTTFLLTFAGFVGFGIFGKISLPLMYGFKAYAILPYVVIFTFAMMCFTISRVFIMYFQAKNYQILSLISSLPTILQVVLIYYNHSNVNEIVQSMSLSGTLSLLLVLILFLIQPNLKNLELNLGDFFELFSKKPNLSKQSSNGKPSILILNWRDTKHKWAGGAEVYIHELAKRWVKEGNQVTIFSGSDRRHPRNEIIDDVRIVRRGGFYTVYFWAYIYYILQFRGKYDIIIDSENGIPFFTPLYAKEQKYLLIHHVHQDVFRKSLKFPFSSIASILEAKLMPLAYRNIQVVTVSPSSKNEIIQHKLTKKDPIVIYNGVDLIDFKPGIKNTRPLILYLGRIQYYKSLNVFIKAAKKILEEIPSAEFIIAGEGGERKKLEKYARHLGMEKKIIFTGKVSHEEKIKLLQKAWIFINPSFMEGWGITTIEANACATPVVASNVPGLKDSIKNSHTGILVSYGDADQFAEKIIQIIKNPKLRKYMGNEAQEWAKNFDWNKSAEKFSSLFIENIQVEKQENVLAVNAYA